MGIGRREFLLLFGGTLARLATGPSAAVAQVEDLYINRRLGIAFSRPPGWSFVRIQEMGQMQRGQLLCVDDPNDNTLILTSLDLPFVAISPEPRYGGRETAGVQFYTAERPSHEDLASVLLREAFGEPHMRTPERKFSPAMQIIRRDWQMARELLHSFRVNTLPEDIEISNCGAAEYTATYEFRHRDLSSPRTIRVRTVAIEHGPRFYLLRLIDSERLAFRFSSFLEKVRLL